MTYPCPKTTRWNRADCRINPSHCSVLFVPHKSLPSPLVCLHLSKIHQQPLLVLIITSLGFAASSTGLLGTPRGRAQLQEALTGSPLFDPQNLLPLQELTMASWPLNLKQSWKHTAWMASVGYLETKSEQNPSLGCYNKFIANKIP